MTQPQKSITGVLNALLTPMLDNGSVDFESLTQLIEHQLKHGVHGFYSGGSTAEGFILTTEERMKVLETVVKQVAQRAKVVAHIGAISTDEAIRLAEHAEQTEVDAISAVVPFYYKVTMTEVREHYLAIMDAVKLPMIIYHFPGATGVQLTMDFYEEMSRNPQCIGVKFTSLNLFEMQQIRARCGEQFLIFNGHDEVFAAGALMGADGMIGSTVNMMPQLYVDLYDHIRNNQWCEVKRLQGEANTIITHMLNYDVIAYEKFMLYAQGIISSPKVRQPLKQLKVEEQQQISDFLALSKVLKR